MADAIALVPASAFAEHLTGASAGAGVRVRERDLRFATVSALKGARETVAEALSQRFGIALPDGPRRAAAGDLALVGTGPRTWLAMRDGAPGLAAELADLLGAHAAVAEQSDGIVALRLSGSRVRDCLAKGVRLDLHDRAFPPGSAASTTCAHLGIVLWRLDDDAEGAVFEVALFRSLAGSFAHFLEESAGEFGLAVEPTGS